MNEPVSDYTKSRGLNAEKKVILKSFRIFLLVSVWLLILPLHAQEIWQDESFDDFSKGTFDDAGANMYISRKGRIQMANRWDVNGDGNIDILSVNSHALIEMLDMSIYWGNGKDFSIRNHSYVPANGPMWVAAGDLNKDGEQDLVVANYSNGTWTEMESFVYYGGLKDRAYQRQKNEWAFYPFKSRILLPGSNAQKPAIGDFNRDGYPDIVFAFSGGFWEYRDKNKEGYSPSRIYWGGAGGFSPANFTNIMTVGATDVAVSDLNGDSWLDLVFSNGGSPESFIYYGGKDGFSENHLSRLPAVKPHAVEIGDINNDKLPDIVFANEKGEVSYAYLNSGGKFKADNRLEFQTYTAKDIVIADFNRDSFTDVFFTNHQFSLTGDPKLANRLINSYLYFGSASGFKTENRQEIQTIGAWGANAADLNEDGWIDLLICNFQEHYSYEVPSFVYWNSPDGFSLTRRTPLYEHGAQGNAIADFDGDGHLDILITSMMGNSRGDYDPSFLYFGNRDGLYSVQDRIEMPGREAYEQAFADLDDDGQVDILLVNRGEVTREANEVWIYWNEQNTFTPWRMSGLPDYAGVGVEVADLDRNGYLDIIVSNFRSYADKTSGLAAPGSFIYWGEAGGWPVTSRSALPIFMTRSPAICDMNNDGYLDLVFGQEGKGGEATIFLGDGSRNFNRDRSILIPGSNGAGTPGVADLNKDGLLDIAFAHAENVLIYYQGEDGSFTLTNSSKIGVQAKTMCVADVNGDDWLDLVCPYYRGEGRRSWYSTVLLGGPDGYDLNRSIQLPTDGGTGSIVSDFNKDGFQDIFLFCHRMDGSFDEIGKFGDHHTNSLLYWGSAEGFQKKNRLEIPGIGAHYDVGIDLGHIRDRKFLYRYISAAHKVAGKKPVSLHWEADTPHESSIRFQIRYADSEDKLSSALWMGMQGINSFYDQSGDAIEGVPDGQWIQYQAVFDTYNGAISPILKKVEIIFQ
jgi:hypothetical protein